MSTISNLGSRSPTSLYTGNQPTDSKPSALQKSQGSTSTSLSSNALDMQKRVASIGNATVDFAQNFVSSFTQALFGDDAKGAVIDFDSASLEASSSYALGYQHTEGANGSTDAAAFSLTDSSHFIGKGTITTADGRKFDFEVEVQYNAELDAAASQTSTNSSSNSSNSTQGTGTDSTPASDQSTDGKSTKDLPTVQVPNIDFPGTLSDLFQLIGRDLQTALATNDKSSNNADNGIDNSALRSLSLRLLNLIDSKDTNTYAAPSAADKAKAATTTAATTDTPTATGTPVATAASPATAATPTTAPATPANDAAPTTGINAPLQPPSA
jgi:hypothetical protein